MSREPQTYANHTRVLPLYHGLTFGLFLVNLVWAVVQVIRAPAWGTVVSFLLAVALIFLFFHARLFALGVQDRVIRLEERLRMERLFDGALRERIGEFTTSQLVGLRFASDDELPALARRVLDEGIRDRKVIKQAIRSWRADHQRI